MDESQKWNKIDLPQYDGYKLWRWRQENLPQYNMTREDKEKLLIITLQDYVDEGKLTAERMEEILNCFGLYKVYPDDPNIEDYEPVFENLERECDERTERIEL